MDGDVGFDGAANGNDLESDVFSFTITISPYDQSWSKVKKNRVLKEVE